MVSEKYKKYNEQIKKYSKEHKLEIARYKKKWTLENQDKVKKQVHKDNNTKYFGGMKDFVLERDNWSCQKCGMNQEQHIIIFGRRITVDHINGNKKDNRMENLMTLCLKCHGSKDRNRYLDSLK